VLIDPISVITNLLTPAKARALIANTITKVLKNMGITTLLIADLPFGEYKVGYGTEEFVADIVIILTTETRGELIRRKMEIRKARGVKLSYGALPFVINNRGIEVIEPLPKEIEGVFREELISTGIKKLDELLGGGLFSSSITAIVGPAGTNKTMLVLTIAARNAMHGRRVLFVSFVESKEQIKTRLKRMGYDPSLFGEKLHIYCISPFGLLEEELLQNLREVINRVKPELYIIDGLEVFNLAIGNEAFIRYTYRRAWELKNLGITLILTMSINYPEERMYIDNLVDNLILIKSRISGDKIEKRMFIWKLMGKKSPSGSVLIEETETGDLIIREE